MEVLRARPDDLKTCFAIRHEVFVREQEVPMDVDTDGHDGECEHFIARVEDGRGVGTARLRRLKDGHVKVERVAVLPNWRGEGIGEALMTGLEAHARRAGHDRVLLASQIQALGFYERLGYQVEGPMFMDAGIPHRRMLKYL